MLKASDVDRAYKQTMLSKQPSGALILSQAWGSCLMQMSECSLALSAPSGQTVALPGDPGGQGPYPADVHDADITVPNTSTLDPH